MRHHVLFLLTITVAFTSSNARGDEPSAEITPDGEQLTPQATVISNELRNAFAPDSEPIVMLDAIIDGTALGGYGGWFPMSKANSRFEWLAIADTFDANSDQKITREEFGGNGNDFARLDRNGDKQLSSDDFDWTESSLERTPGYMMFFMADRDANGKVTREEFSALYDQVAGRNASYLTLDDLRDQFQPPDTVDHERRANRPSRSTLIAALQRQEIGSLQSGPRVGEIAPDFSLVDLNGKTVTLSDEVGEKPIVLIFGNFTCGPFRSQSGNIEKLYRTYQERAKFFLVYVREAHPSDGWQMASNQRVGIDVPQPTSQDGRRKVAQQCQSHLDMDLPFLVDDVGDTVGEMYSGMPNRLYLIDRQGNVAFRNGRGPYGFHPRELEQALILLLRDDREDGQKDAGPKSGF
ncbi:deiodinase family protein [Rhodopirellula sp. MGV]|uniref:deiodinase family protein n=1 Tax=Rhodopirellula sp. MGV TaxID=2023130 RepID=UPI000B972A15|nr:deiodinase family protein [Rhodopirellula sp. MGV]OYP28967.1 hypothetical protein CGZ80_25750 [Rhodopirellula sp. MGV]PNY36918.1 hypothetical protein C2E31_09855 [Rhodopirellula baltica]